jgi:hypothetical protein
MFEKITSLLITLGTLFFSTITGTNATFSNVVLSQNEQGITCSATLTDWYNEELNKIFLLGEKIRIHFTAETFEENADSPVYRKQFYHQIMFDLVDEYFEIYYSESNEKFITYDIAKATDYLARVDNVLIVEFSTLEPNKRYYIKFTAEMGPLYLDAVEKNIDLMMYWNNKKASFTSSLFSRPHI